MADHEQLDREAGWILMTSISLAVALPLAFLLYEGVIFNASLYSSDFKEFLADNADTLFWTTVGGAATPTVLFTVARWMQYLAAYQTPPRTGGH